MHRRNQCLLLYVVACIQMSFRNSRYRQLLKYIIEKNFLLISTPNHNHLCIGRKTVSPSIVIACTLHCIREVVSVRCLIRQRGRLLETLSLLPTTIQQEQADINININSDPCRYAAQKFRAEQNGRRRNLLRKSTSCGTCRMYTERLDNNAQDARRMSNNVFLHTSC